MENAAITMNPDDLKEMAVIVELFRLMDLKPADDLHMLMSDELTRYQPALSDTCRHLLRTGKYNLPQLVEVVRIFVVVYCYYATKLPLPQPFIKDPLYRRMMHNQVVWEDGFRGRDPEYCRRRWVRSVEEFPSKSLYKYLLDRCVHKPVKRFKKLSIQDRIFLFHNIKVVLDCYEWLVKECGSVRNSGK